MFYLEYEIITIIIKNLYVENIPLECREDTRLQDEVCGGKLAKASLLDLQGRHLLSSLTELLQLQVTNSLQLRLFGDI